MSKSGNSNLPLRNVTSYNIEKYKHLSVVSHSGL